MRFPEKALIATYRHTSVDSRSPIERVFRHEHFDVYQISLDFIAMSHRIIGKLGRGELANQLERAATSIALNASEGSGEFSSKEKSRFYRMALRSCAECSTVLDVAHRLDAVQQKDYEQAKLLLGRIAAMLTAMIRVQAQRRA